MDKKIILLIVSLTFLFVLVYSPHFNQPLPYHHDEWVHISNSASMKEQGFSYFLKHPIESGFAFLLLIISLFVNLITIYKFLPAINALIIGIILFSFLEKRFNYWIGLFSIIFLASLKSNANIMGIWFYVPIIAVIILDYLCLFTLEDSIKENNPKKMYLVLLYLFLIGIIHQSSFLVISLVVLIYLSINYKFLINNKKYFYPFLILMIPSIIVFLHFTNNLTNIGGFFKNFIWGPIMPQINYNPFLFYGFLSSIFAVIGFIIAYQKKKLLPFRIYLFIPLINIILFPLTKISIFSAYQRYLYHFMIAMIPFSAIGFYYLIKKISKLLNKNKIIKITGVSLFIILSIVLIFYNYYDLHSQAKVYISVYPDEIEALGELKDYPKGRILVPTRMGSATKFIADKETIISYSNFKYFNNPAEFYGGDCNIKENFLYNISTKHYIKTDYVYSDKQINCSFLEELYTKNKKSVYSVKLNYSDLH